MSIEKSLEDRSGNKCELCSAESNLTVFEVTGSENRSEVDSHIHICRICVSEINDSDSVNTNHWRCLNDSIWSEVDAVKVQAWRTLTHLKGEGWTQDLLDMMYIEDDLLIWAKADGTGEDPTDKVIHKDSNGVTLTAGDSVVLIKDLNVKGGGFTAKRGTAVRRISLVHDNPEHIEGRVEGQQVVILTQYVKKL